MKVVGSHGIHVYGIFTYVWLIFYGIHVGKLIYHTWMNHGYRKWINNRCPKNGEPLTIDLMLMWRKLNCMEASLSFVWRYWLDPPWLSTNQFQRNISHGCLQLGPPKNMPKIKRTHQISKFHAANSEKTSTLSKQQTVYPLYRYTETWDARCNFTSQRFMSSCSSWEIPGEPKINVSKGLRKKNTCFMCFSKLLNENWKHGNHEITIRFVGFVDCLEQMWHESISWETTVVAISIKGKWYHYNNQMQFSLSLHLLGWGNLSKNRTSKTEVTRFS